MFTVNIILPIFSAQMRPLAAVTLVALVALVALKANSKTLTAIKNNKLRIILNNSDQGKKKPHVLMRAGHEY